MPDRKKHDGTVPDDLETTDLQLSPELRSLLPDLVDDPGSLDPAVFGPVTLQLLQQIAHADLGDYMTWGPRGVMVKDSTQLTPLQRKLITEVKEDKDGNVTVKLCSKEQAIRLLAQASGIVQDTQKRSLGGTLEDLIDVLRSIDGQTRGLPPKVINGNAEEVDGD